ncbi:MAG: glycosyltransferase family 2 protein [Bacteroidetes bacterium]|nr:glycosyltransferase family 2 protein [Bacteroidota bacterium]
MSARVAVVILNFNTARLLEQFLPRVLQTDYPNFEVVVADNASSDDSVNLCNELFPQVRLIEIEENLGYAGGYNHALKQVHSDYYVLLNSDVEVPANWLTPLVNMAENDARIAAAQPVILDYYKKTHFEYAGAAGGWIDRYGYPFCRGRVFHVLEEQQGQYANDSDIFWASGAAMFVRARDFHDVGGFDAHFFAHMEEIDLCWRLQLAGKRIVHCPDSAVYHMGGGTLSHQSAYKTYLNFRNGLLLLEKNLPEAQRSGIIFRRLLLDGIAAVKFFMGGKFSHAWSIWKAHRYFHKNRKRFRPERPIELQPLTGYYKGSIVWDFYARGRRYFNAIVKH